jgi:hypothetical protein
MFLRQSHLAIVVSLALALTVRAGEPLQRQTASSPLIMRAPRITAERAIELAAKFLRDHNADPSAYFVSELNWSSTTEEPEKDAWVIVWTAKDRKANPLGFTTVVLNDSKVAFASTM